MKLSEIRPCDACGGAIATGSYLLRLSLLVVSPRAVNQVLGLNQIFGGALKLAEAFAPDDNPVKVAGEEDPSLWTDALVCQRCALGAPIDLGLLLAKRAEEGVSRA